MGGVIGCVVILAPLGTNQSERSKFSLDQSESRISPMWLMWRHNAHIWAWFYTWPHGIKNTHTQELNLHSSHSFNDRVEPGYKRDVGDLQMRSRPFFSFIDWNVHTQNKDKENAFWQMWSWDWDEAMECNGWTLIETMVWSNENGNDRRYLKRIRKSTQKIRSTHGF